MSILIFLIVVVIIVAMLVYAVDYLSLTAPFNNLIKALIIILGVLIIANRAGLVGSVSVSN